MKLKAITGIALTMLLLAVVSPIDVSVGVVDSDGGSEDFMAQSGVDCWPMFRHDLSNTGYSTSTAPNTNNTIWTYPTGGAVHSSPAVFDGRVYVGSLDDKVYCLNATTGAHIWNYTTSLSVYSSPAVAYGKVYVGSWDGKVYCLNASTGAHVWNYTTGGQVSSSPAVADGRVYVGSYDRNVYCLNATTGAHIWNYTTGGDHSSPAVADGRVYVGSYAGAVLCLDALNGTLIWSYPISSEVSSSPAVAYGKVYVGSWDGGVYCLNATTGAYVWCYPTGDYVSSSPAVADGRVYVGSNDRKVYCLNASAASMTPNEREIWNYPTYSLLYSSPAVADGKVYVGSIDDKVYCLNASDGAHVWSYTTGGQVSSSPAVADGRVYVGSSYYKVYAFGPPPSYTLTVHSSPTGVTFTVDDVSRTTPWPGTYSEDTSVSLVMPEIHTVGDAKYYWNQWSDGNTSRLRTVTMTANITLTAYYAGPYHELTITSSPMTGITFTINGTPQMTPHTEWLLEGSYTLEMPETYDGYIWSHWLEDGEPNRTKTVIMETDILLTAVFTPPDTTPPTISIISPENKTYPVEDVPLTFAFGESTSWAGYSLDGQANVTVTGNTTLSGLSDGSHTLIVYAKDTTGNTGASKIINFTIETPQEEEEEKVPFWMQWWFYAIVGVVTVALAVTVYFLKKRKPPTPARAFCVTYTFNEKTYV